MKNKTITLIYVITSIILSGCGLMLGEILTLSLPSSEYSLNYLTEIGANTFYDKLRKNDSVLVKDEIGEYFHKEIQDNVFMRFIVLNQEKDFLKFALTSTQGLMEPVYSFNTDIKLRIDREKTERRYIFLSKDLGLNLLPLKTTYEYNELIEKYADYINDRQSQTGFTVAAMSFYGEQELYNPEYYDKVISKIKRKISYIAGNITSRRYFSSLILSGSDKLDASSIRGLAESLDLQSQYSINFIPIEYLKTLKRGGAYREYTGCSFLLKERAIKELRYTNESTAIPYISGIYAAIKINSENKKNNAKKNAEKLFHNKNNKINNEYKLAEESCKIGFKELGLSGFIGSKKLL